MRDTLNRWEKAALITVGSASAFNVLLWALGAGLVDARPALSPLGVARVAFAVLSFVGLDLTIVVTVMAQRDGRRGRWAWLTSTAAMLGAGGMALEVAHVVALPWLHAAPVVVLWCFMHHLAAPRVAGDAPSGDSHAPLAPALARVDAPPAPVYAPPVAVGAPSEDERRARQRAEVVELVRGGASVRRAAHVAQVAESTARRWVRQEGGR